MSYATLTKQSLDQTLIQRVIAAAMQEAFENPAMTDTEFADIIKRNSAQAMVMIWPVSIATEAEYASALAAGHPNPGGDESVISDGMILGAVQANWPPDEAPA
jgi:hypothetical protein